MKIQKQEVIKYCLCFSKGLFEDLDAFCTKEVEDNYRAYTNAVEDFIEYYKDRLLADLSAQGE